MSPPLVRETETVNGGTATSWDPMAATFLLLLRDIAMSPWRCSKGCCSDDDGKVPSSVSPC